MTFTNVLIELSTLLLLVSVPCVSAASLSAEKLSEAVEFYLYRVDLTKWEGVTTDFKTKLVAQANVFCSDAPSSCGLLYWDLVDGTFSTLLVGVTAKEDGNDLKVTTYLQFPALANVSSVSTTRFVVNKVAVKTMLRNIISEINLLTNSYVTYIGEEYFGIPQAQVLNSALIPVAVGVLIIVICIAVGLHCWNKRKHKKKIAREIASSKVTPVLTLGGGNIGKHMDTHDNLKGSNVNNIAKESHQMKKVVSPSRNSQQGSLNEFVEIDETRPHNAPATTLPPLSVEDTDSGHKRDKKHKKRKKKKHHRPESSDTVQEPAQSDGENRSKQRESSDQRNRPVSFDNSNYYDSDAY